MIGFAILASVVLARTWVIEGQNAENAAVFRVLQTERQLLATLSLIQDAETGQRGYLLSGEETYLEPYRGAVDTIPAAMASVRELVKNNVVRNAQLDDLSAAVDAKLKELDATIALQRAGDINGALDLVKSDRGKSMMDVIRAQINAMLQEENLELEARLTQAATAENVLWWVSLVAFFVVFALGFYVVWDGRRRLIEVAAAHAGLARANATLQSEMDMRQKSEAQLRQLQKMEAIGQLTGGIAHDFNNMLAVIMSAMNLAQRKLARGEADVQRFVEAAIDAATRAANLTARLLAFSRQQPLAPNVIDANRLVSGMSELLGRTLGETVELETILAGGVWRTHADASQLENAILNLTVNARDAMPEGGKLTVETANCHLDDEYAAAHEEVVAGQYVMIAVSDTGTGMSAEVIAKAFDPFFTTKAISKGTGLGLSQVFGFVKQSGGHVKVYSELGAGTTVKIYLPRHFGDDVSDERAHKNVNVHRRATETILVVEDDPRVRNSTVAVLRDLGYRVFHASEATEALRKLDETPGVDLLFTDVVMPGKSGRKLAEEALQKFPQLKVLYTTGFTKNAVVHNGVLDQGVNFIAKPFTMDQLAAKLSEVLD